jgi:hypothetical protein
MACGKRVHVMNPNSDHETRWPPVRRDSMERFVFCGLKRRDRKGVCAKTSVFPPDHLLSL